MQLKTAPHHGLPATDTDGPSFKDLDDYLVEALAKTMVSLTNANFVHACNTDLALAGHTIELARCMLLQALTQAKAPKAASVACQIAAELHCSSRATLSP